MNIWIVIAMVGILLIAGTFGVMALNKTDITQNNPTAAKTCSSCGNSCTAESNCGLASCGAVSGKGSCTCGKK